MDANSVDRGDGCSLPALGRIRLRAVGMSPGKHAFLSEEAVGIVRIVRPVDRVIMKGSETGLA